MFLKLALPAALLMLVLAYLEWEQHNSIHRPFTVDELEEHLRSKFSLTEVKLVQLSDGRVEGTGTSDTGRRYQFDIRQSEDDRRIVGSYEMPGGRQSGVYDGRTAFGHLSHYYFLFGFLYLVRVAKVLWDHKRTKVAACGDAT